MSRPADLETKDKSLRRKVLLGLGVALTVVGLFSFVLSAFGHWKVVNVLAIIGMVSGPQIAVRAWRQLHPKDD
jgi:hypothetical protein